VRFPLALLVVLLLALTGCAREEPPATPTVWRVHRAEAAEGHPAEVMLTRTAEGAAPPRLVIGCLDEATSAYVEWGRRLGEGPVSVVLRLGDGAEQAAEWVASADGEAVGLWADSVSVPFVRSLVGPPSLHVRTADARGEPLDATFALNGLGDLVGEVATLCAWP